MRRLTALGLTASLVLLPILAGCQTPGEKLAEETYTQAYQARRYDQALKLAEARTRDTDAPAGDRERAALVAGLSAYALGKQSVASSYMRPLVTSTDKQVAGRANWTLGQIEAERGNHVEAAKYLTTAGTELDSDDSARAYLLAGDCYARLKMASQAREFYEKASVRAVDPGVKSMVDARLGGQAPPAISKPGTGGVPLTTGGNPPGTTPGTGTKPGSATADTSNGFTVQLGAFEKLESAQKLAAQATPGATKASAPAPAVVTTSAPDGRTLYAVRIGQYPTREAAQAVLTRLGGKGTVIAIRK